MHNRATAWSKDWPLALCNAQHYITDMDAFWKRQVTPPSPLGEGTDDCLRLSLEEAQIIHFSCHGALSDDWRQFCFDSCVSEVWQTRLADASPVLSRLFRKQATPLDK